MDKERQARLESRAAVIKAMAHPTRLFIVEQLSRRARCVGELTERVGADTSTVSKHLFVMKKTGVVSDAKRGSQVFYSLRIPCIVRFFGCIDAVMKSVARERMKLARSG